MVAGKRGVFRREFVGFWVSVSGSSHSSTSRPSHKTRPKAAMEMSATVLLVRHWDVAMKRSHLNAHAKKTLSRYSGWVHLVVLRDEERLNEKHNGRHQLWWSTSYNSSARGITNETIAPMRKTHYVYNTFIILLIYIRQFVRDYSIVPSQQHGKNAEVSLIEDSI